MNESPSETLAAALVRHGLSLAGEQIELLDRYCRSVWRWNEQLNLTRHTDYDKFVSRDLVDTLELAALVPPGAEVLDMGSGGGVPGVVLAIVRPDLVVALSESVAKRAKVLQAIVQELGLPVVVHHARAEEVLDDLRFDAVTVRAVAPLWKILKWVQPHWPSPGRLLVVKGSKWAEERGEARHRGLLRELALRCAARYATPGTDAQNVILEIRPKMEGASPEAEEE